MQGVRTAPEAVAAGGPNARTSSPTGWTSTASPAAGTSRPSSSPAASTTEWLEQVAAEAPPEILEGAVRWLAYTLETELLMGEIEDSVTRISDPGRRRQAVLPDGPGAVSSASTSTTARQHPGDARRQDSPDLDVVKEYDRTLPPIPAYAAELNQVWTNLIDNAVQADGRQRHAHPAHRARRRHGPRRDRRHRPRHPAGGPAADLRAVLHHQAGRRGHRARAGHLLPDRGRTHRGDIRVESEPGDTRFIVRLPLTERPSS